MLQALSLVEKPELVQVRFTLRLRDHRSIYVDGFLRGIERIMFHGHLDFF
jgi:hypothetical protein